jgi:peptidoglycan/LPS O-acetylase OafA/YrhL
MNLKTATEARTEKRTPKRTIELDFARGLAVILVMGYHFKTAPTTFPLWIYLDKAWKGFGATGVDMFFVLSGFLVGGLLLDEYRTGGEVRAKRFLIRRAMKIFPAYYFYILFQILTRHFPLHTFLVQNLFQIQNYVGSSISHSWTVSLEVHFYILLAICMAVLASRKASPKALIIFFACVSAISFGSRFITIYLGNSYSAIFETHNRLDSLMCGVLLATLACFYPNIFEKLSARLWPLLLILALFAVYLWAVYPATMKAPAPGWGYFGATILYLGYATLMLFLLRYSKGATNWLPYRGVAWIGTYSYGIYLWHNSVRQPCEAIAQHVNPAIRWPFLYALQYVCAILLGALMTVAVEWPFLRLRERVIPQKEVQAIDRLVHTEVADGNDAKQTIAD